MGEVFAIVNARSVRGIITSGLLMFANAPARDQYFSAVGQAMEVAVIGGGAAGFFAAISVKSAYPEAQVTIFEKSQKLLAKVQVSGGGRCNVTNGSTSISELAKAYPRGGKQMKKALAVFNTKHIVDWFENRGVELYTQEDGRVFPRSDSSQTVIDLFLQECEKLGIAIKTGSTVVSLTLRSNQLELVFANGQKTFDKVIVASGGSPKREGLKWLEDLGHKIEEPVPSLFTFNLPKDPVIELMGVVAPNAIVGLQGSKLRSQGPLLVTHWGFSGPAALKLSAFGARLLHEKAYSFNLQVNWCGAPSTEVSTQLESYIQENPNKLLSNIKPFDLPERLWDFLLEKSTLPNKKIWGELGKKGLNKLIELLTNDIYSVKGKTTFKEEFVTCGGVSWESVDPKTMKSKAYPGLYFAGEVLDVDGITGGYNFQAAWTTAFIAAQLK